MYNKRFCCENSRVESWLVSPNIENSCYPNISTISKFPMFNAGMNCYKSDFSSEGSSVDTARYVLLNTQKNQNRVKSRNRRNVFANNERRTKSSFLKAADKNEHNQFKKSKNNRNLIEPIKKTNKQNKTDYLKIYQNNLLEHQQNSTKKLSKKKSTRDEMSTAKNHNINQMYDKKIPKTIDVYTPRKKLSKKNKNITINRDELIDIIGATATNEVLQSSKSLTFSENSKVLYILPEKDSYISESDDDVFLKLKHNGFLRTIKG